MTTETSKTETTLTVGQVYDVAEMLARFAGWTVGDGTGSDGYRVEDYFDGDGKYLGPDQNGIEPTFTA